MTRKGDHRYNILFAFLFGAIMAVPLVSQLTGWYKSPEVSERENRNLAKQPEFDMSLLDPFPPLYEAWYNDHFFMREKLIDLNIWSQLNIMQESPFPDKVTIGKDGWLFDAAKERELYEGNMSIPPEGYRYIMQELHMRTLWYRSQGIRFYVLIAPLKHDISPEYLPAYYHRAPGGTLTDKLVNYIRKDTVIRLITAKEEQLAQKNRFRLYAKLDNHWNFIGGYFGYRALMNEISRDFPQVKPLEISEFGFREDESHGGNLAGMIGLTGKVREETWIPEFPNLKSVRDPGPQDTLPDAFPFLNDSEVHRHIPDSRMPSILVIRDSYGIHLFPFISETFGMTTFYFDGWNYHLNADIALREKPDIVVLEIFEPYFKNVLYYSLDLVMEEYRRTHPQ